VTQVIRIVEDAAGHSPDSGGRLWLGHAGSTFTITSRSREQELHAQLSSRDRVVGSASPDVRSPMPGTVVGVSVSTGDAVEAGDVLLTVEAMKMEHKLTAALAGVVTISVSAGDLVKLDQVVASIDAETAPSATAAPTDQPPTHVNGDPS
jgi:acetyl-CoA/propionyl-CoA carboxylase biotin carboxyl carrier protein